MKIQANEKLAHQVKQVLVDGEDVTADCFECDDEAGYVLCFRREAPKIQERREGKVEIIWK